MSTAVVPFQFRNNAIRTVTLDGEHWFVAKDVAEALGYKDTTKAIKLHCKGGAKCHPLPTAGGTQQARIIREPDLYRLIVGSTLPAAVEFEAWVFEEVLPALRKSGRYAAQEPTKAAANRRFFAHTDDEGRLTLQELTDEIVVAPKELPRLLCDPAFVLGQTTGEHKARCLELATAASMRVNFGGNVAWELLYGDEHGKRAAMREIARRTNA